MPLRALYAFRLSTRRWDGAPLWGAIGAPGGPLLPRAPHQGPQKALKTHASSHLLSFSVRVLPRPRKRGVKSESYADTWAMLRDVRPSSELSLSTELYHLVRICVKVAGK